MQFLSTIALSATLLIQLGTSLPVGSSWNSTTNGTQTLDQDDNANNSTAANSTMLAAEGANNITGGKLPLELINHLPSDNIYAYVTGQDASGQLILLDSNNEWFYPKAEGGEGEKTPLPDHVKHKLGPQFSTTKFTLPDYIYSSRIWFGDGGLDMFVVKTPDGQGLAEPSALNRMDPNNVTNWGFVELTNSKDWGLYANLSFVDFVGMALGIKLRRSGNDTQEAKGVPTAGKYKICDDLKAQAAKDGQPWGELCVYDDKGDLMRVVSPAGFLSTNLTAFENYWYPYTNETADRYESDVLTIDTQSPAGKVDCRWQASTNASANGNMELMCDGDTRPFPPPTSEDVFGCNTGPFAIQEGDSDVHKAIVPRLCAAYNRGTLLINGGDVQPGVDPTQYYPSSSSSLNWYSKITHDVQIDHRGYAFSYDDVTIDPKHDAAGVVTGTNPELLTIVVGGYEDKAAAILQSALY